MSDPLRVGSLFSGIGGIDLGLERAGMKVVWQCEANPFARRVLAKHWPGVPCYEDVRGVTNDGSVEIPDLLCGGFPCQDISFAGLGAGLDGERSGLWFEYHRIIREFRPRYVLVENVAALLVRGIDRVLGSLAAIGYDAEWESLPASAFGAPHFRNRIFLVAYPCGKGLSRPVFKRESLRESTGKTSTKFGNRIISCGIQWLDDFSNLLLGNGLPARLGRRPIRAYGNAVVPQVAEFIGKRIVDFHRRQTIHV